MLTPEQCYAVDYSTKRLPLKVIAFAGAGKTSTLVEMAKQAGNRRGLYIAFNKAIATDAACKFPRNVQCKTAHSLAFRDVINRGFSNEKMYNSPKSREFDLPRIDVPFHADKFRSIVGTVIRRFCQSDAATITENLVPKIDGLKEDEQEFVYHWAPIAAAETWSRMIDPGDPLPMGHDGYLKLWALGRPRLYADFIMVDEAQDLNPVLIGVVRNQPAQLILVGDEHQQIYQFRGAKDALLILPGHEARLTRSFRFGEAIAAAANGVLQAMGEQYPLQGFMANDTVSDGRSPNVDAVLCRSNAAVIEQAFDFIAAGRQVWTPGGTGEMRSLIDDAEALQNHRIARSAELLGFANWHDVKEFANTDEGRNLRTFVNLVGRYGCSRLRNVLDAIQGSRIPGGVAISTAHKAKGLEFPSVQINEDFFAGEDGRVSVAERRLFYVAITRAEKTLFVDPDTLDAFSTPEE